MAEKNINEKVSIPLDASTALSVTRTRLSAERTLMSWIRTSFSLITFGFTIIKFFEYLKGRQTTVSIVHMPGSTRLGAILILLGIFSLIPAIIEYRRELKLLNAMGGRAKLGYAFVLGILIGIIGIYALIDSIFIRFF